MNASQSSDSGHVQQYELVQSGFKLRFDFSADVTVCTARYEASAGGTPLDEASLRQFMNGCKVFEGVHEASVQMLLSVAAEKKSISGIIIAHSTAMQPGDDGYLEFLVHDSLEEQNNADGAEKSAVCFKNVQTFLNVNPGDIVAVIHPPTTGVPGRTVQGESIPPKPGIPCSITPGTGIRIGDDGKTLYAETSGRVNNTGSELTVEDVYTVEGDVDYRVGNIDFNGFVEISGDVLDGFRVKATRGIKIKGIVGSAELESNGDVEICGMNGQGTGKIVCNGNLTLNFCNDTRIICEGDVTAQVEIRNCSLRCMGTLRIIKGTFGGGSCIVLAGMETGSIGTKTSLATTVMAGVNFHDFDEIEALNKLLVELNQSFTATPENKRNLAVFITERNKLTEQMQEVRERRYSNSNAKINVHKIMYENARLTLGQYFYITRDEITGPLSLIGNNQDGGIRQLEMTPLSISAEQLEQALMLEEAMGGK